MSPAGDYGQELRDLWEAVESLRSQQSVTNALLAEIRATLNERCEHRGAQLDDLERDVAALQGKVWWFSGASAALAFAFSKLIPLGVGK